MGRLAVGTIAALVLAYRLIAHLPAAPPPAVQAPAVRPPSPAAPSIDLAARLAGGTLRPVNREIARLDGMPGGVHVSEKEGPGVVWVDGSDFAEGTIEVSVRGRDLQQRSFVGIAFHRKDDATYEAVYLRPFNFRAEDPARRQNAVQYISVPDYDWPRLRKEFPSEFENPVDASVEPTDWVPLKIVVKGAKVQVYVGAVQSPTASPSWTSPTCCARRRRTERRDESRG
jgi:hypothetical protein